MIRVNSERAVAMSKGKKLHDINCKCNAPKIEAAKHHWPILKKLQRGGGGIEKRRAIFNHSKNCMIKFIGQCCRAVLTDVIKLLENNYKKLGKNLNDLIFLADKNKSVKSKRSLLVNQGGGFLSLILPALASALFRVLGNIFTKKVL